MSAPLHIDLPVEIWLHIISFLPSEEIRRLSGLNHLFYEAAMDDTFRKVTFYTANTTWCNLKRLAQLQYASSQLKLLLSTIEPFPHRQPEINRRIRALRVNTPLVIPQPRPAGVFSYLKTMFFHWKHKPRPEDLVIKAMHRAIIHCKNVEDLDLYHESALGLDHIPYPLFLQDMWATVGQNLRKLKVDSPSERFALLLDAEATISVTNLEELMITISRIRSLRSRVQSMSTIATSHPLIAFVQAQRHSLQSLTLTSRERLNLASYIDGFGYLPSLKQFKIRVTFNPITFPNPSTLTRFLNMHKATLQIIDIQCNYEYETYSAWISHDLPALEFPVLQTLGIGMWTSQFPQVPRLRILDICIDHYDTISEMIEGLHRSSGKNKVKQFDYIFNNTLRVELHDPHCPTW